MGTDGVTLEALAAHFHLLVSELEANGCRTRKHDGKPAVAIPYLDPSGSQTLAVQYRTALRRNPAGPDDRFRFRSGDRAQHLYGLNRLELARTGWILVVEGASDCWVAWHYGLPAVGVPGKGNWKSVMVPHLAGLAVFVWCEPDAEDFIERIARDIPTVRVIFAPDGIKDIAQAHVDGLDVPTLLDKLRTEAVPFADIECARRENQAGELRAAAAEVLATDDPLRLIRDALAANYGGDLKAPLLLYLAATTRLLALRPGSMPCHVLVLGPASVGKSYTANVVLNLLPDEAKHEIDAGSPRVLIYDAAELQYKVLVFGESDSLPAGEDNPAASAVRGLLQDNRLHYKATVRDPETGDFVVRDIDKPGPTAFLSTSTRPLPGQLGTRVFNLEAPDGNEHLCAALAKQANLELEGANGAPPECLLAFQGYLQSLAPWDVVVPFARVLSAYLGAQPIEPRVTRDFAKLLSLVKAAAILRHPHRERDRAGRLVATSGDYATVYDLVAPTYAAACGASERVRQVVAAVAELLASGREYVKQAEIAKRIGKSRSTVSGHVTQAIAGGWLINAETAQGRPAKLKLGESLPDKAGLPTPARLAELFASSAPSESAPNSENGQYAGAFDACSAVRSHTAGNAEDVSSADDEGHDGEGDAADQVPLAVYDAFDETDAGDAFVRDEGVRL